MARCQINKDGRWRKGHRYPTPPRDGEAPTSTSCQRSVQWVGQSGRHPASASTTKFCRSAEAGPSTPPTDGASYGHLRAMACSSASERSTHSERMPLGLCPTPSLPAGSKTYVPPVADHRCVGATSRAPPLPGTRALTRRRRAENSAAPSPRRCAPPARDRPW